MGMMKVIGLFAVFALNKCPHSESDAVFPFVMISSPWKNLSVTRDHKTSHKGQFFEIEIYTSPESWINKLSIDVWWIWQYLGLRYNIENLQSEVA